MPDLEPDPPLHYEASAGATHLQVCEDRLPDDVVTCLQNVRFLHLATCTALRPHVSLMNYTYLPTSPHTPRRPCIIMTTNPASQKCANLVANPHVSLLVHDWVSPRPPTSSGGGGHAESSLGQASANAGAAARSRGSPPPEAARSSLASLLLGLNTSALSSISATINGLARLVERGTEEERFFKERHLENNTFEEGQPPLDLSRIASHGPIGVNGAAPMDAHDGGRGTFIEDEEVRVVVVEITDGRVADWKGGVRDWTLRRTSTEAAEGQG